MAETDAFRRSFDILSPDRRRSVLLQFANRLQVLSGLLALEDQSDMVVLIRSVAGDLQDKADEIAASPAGLDIMRRAAAFLDAAEDLADLAPPRPGNTLTLH